MTAPALRQAGEYPRFTNKWPNMKRRPVFERVRARIAPSSVDKLVAEGRRFRDELQVLKEKHPPTDFSWYPYDTLLGNLPHFPHLFGGRLYDLFAGLQGPVADIGGADGELAFLLERQGYDVDLIDYPATNWNRMKGAYALRDLLSSRIGIFEVDLDSQFDLPRSRYELIFFLHILYHLKNPFYALEKLSYMTKRLVLSTRIARMLPDGDTDISRSPVAYLVDADECNHDATNFWIFSHEGLRRLVSRAGWRIEEYYSAGDLETSNPRDANHDERGWMTLSSTKWR